MRVLFWAVLLGGVLATAPAAAGEIYRHRELFRPKVTRIDKFPRQVARGKKVRFAVRVLRGFNTPRLVCIAPNGKTYVVENHPDPDAPAVRTYDHPFFGYDIPFDEGKGPYRFELNVHSKTGSMYAARFTIYSGVLQPPESRLRPAAEGPPISKDLHPRLIEKRLMHMINEGRRRLGLKPLVWNEEVASRAREHASLMSQAGRSLHKFGGKGIREMLQDGGGTGELWSERTGLWRRVRARIPFHPYNPRPPEDSPLNYVAVHVLAEPSLEMLYEKYYVREPIFRIFAADPNGREIAIGAAWEPKARKLKDDARVFLAVAFVQVNNTLLQKRHANAWAAAYDYTRRHKDPRRLRALAVWDRRKKTIALLKPLLRRQTPEVAGAALDGLLLVDEDTTRREFERALDRSRAHLKYRRYGQAAAVWPSWKYVSYDRALAVQAVATIAQCDRAALAELREIQALQDEAERTARLRELRKRCDGLPVAARIDKALQES
ncbi:MAG: CAP domain-containing protein [Planctomycetota bacterium]